MARRLHLSLAATAAAVLLAVPVQAAPVKVELRAEKASVSTVEDVHVRFTLKNIDRKDVDVLTWHTPFGADLDSNIFVVTRDGAAVAYLGALAKRPAPAAEDFVRVPKGQSRTARVELTSLYDMSQPGRYEISYRGAEGDVVPATGSRAMLPSNTVVVDVYGEARPSDDEFMKSLGSGAEARTLAYNKCTASQQPVVAQSVADANAYADAARVALGNSTTGNRFLTWFKSTTNKPKALQNFQAIDAAFDNAAITVDCGCKKQYYAYVYPNQPYKIWVCRVFWQAPALGQDSKAGTMVHEMSHFDVVAGTDDLAYGHSACKALSASQAINNADTHEYYAENTPNLGPY
jgi:peptidyl-Lys metalloendopeptidase